MSMTFPYIIKFLFPVIWLISSKYKPMFQSYILPPSSEYEWLVYEGNICVFLSNVYYKLAEYIVFNAEVFDTNNRFHVQLDSR